MSTVRVLTVFRVIAAIEAFTWAGLLIGMFFKYVVVHDEIGVQVFGPLHGVAFIGYVLVALLTWSRLRWSLWTGALALLASIPPLATLVFERWASATGRNDLGTRTEPAAPAA